MNKKYVAQIIIPKIREPFIKGMVLVNKEDGLGSNEISHIEANDKFVYCVSELLILCILF